MKNWIVILILSFFIPQSAFAWTGITVCGGSVASASCSTSNDSEIYAHGSSATASATDVYIATKIVLGSDTTVTEYVANACRVSSAAESYTFSLYTHDGGNDEPDTQISNTSATLANSELSNQYSYNDELVTLGTPELVSAQTVWLVSYASSGLLRVSRGASSGRTCVSADAATWSCVASTTYLVALWGCQ